MADDPVNIYLGILKETVQHLQNAIKGIEERLGRMDSSIAVLQYKSGVWGAIGAMATILALLLVERLKK